MLRTYALWFGLAFLVLAGLGFVPVLAPAGYLFGVFQIGGAHNLVHLATGLVALLAAALGAGASRLFFRVFAGLYGLLVLAGIYYGDRPLFGVVAHNWPDVWLHLAIAALALYLGFFARRPYPAHP